MDERIGRGQKAREGREVKARSTTVSRPGRIGLTRALSPSL